MRKFTASISAVAITVSCLPALPVFAAQVGSTSVAADKTAQWTAQEANTYDGRIHGWETYETAEYIGFSLENFTADDLSAAELVVTSSGVGRYYTGDGPCYVYSADYSSFASGGDYTGTANAPKYNSEAVTSFTIPWATGEYSIDLTDYFKTLAAGTANAAFRLDVKSVNNTCDWRIGTLTNGGAAPELVLRYGDVITNAKFADGTDGWTIDGSTEVKDGVLNISGSNYKTRVSQSISQLSDGVYDLTVNASVSDIDGVYYVYAKTAGHTMASTAIPKGGAMQKVIVPGIVVEDGKCDIGVYAAGSAAVKIDDFAIEKSADSATRIPYLKGGEISKLTYVEDRGGKFYRADGTEADALQIMAENGFNLARIRVLNDPGKGHSDGYYYLPEGYQNEEDCLELARRAKDKGMQIEFTFAYSDTWSDGANQIIPHEWQEYIDKNSLEGEDMYSYLETQVYEYTKDIMEKLAAQGTTPEYVSIGNEMQTGLFYGNWEKAYNEKNPLYYNADTLARFVNAGAKAVREVSPSSKVVVHSDNGGKVSSTRNAFIGMLSKADYDVIGVSFYPYYNSDVTIDTVAAELSDFVNKYNKDVMIMETGYNWTENTPDGYDGQLKDSGYYTNVYGETQNGQRAFLTELYSKLKQIAGGRCIADLYWDPVMIYDGGVEHTRDAGIGWAIDEQTDITAENVVPNSTIFDFSGKAVAGQLAMKYNTNSSDKVLITGKVTNGGKALADTKIKISVNGSSVSTATDKFGEYIAAVDYPSGGKLEINAKGGEEKYSKDAPYDGILVSGINFTGDIAENSVAAIDESKGYAASGIWEPNAGNPIIPAYIGDPFMFRDEDGTFYVYGTTDGNGETADAIFHHAPYAVWYSKDLVNWKSKVIELDKESVTLWAPAVTRVGDKYYMAYIWNGNDCYLAESDSPLGPWKTLNNGEKLEDPTGNGGTMFDNDIVTLEDGNTYLVTKGTSNTDGQLDVYIGKFKEDMSGLEWFKLVYVDKGGFEGAGLFYRNGKYYITYSQGTLGYSYHVRYAMSDKIDGDYTAKGALLSFNNDWTKGIVCTGHSNCIEINGDWYICYHRKSAAYNHARQAAMEKLTFNDDGTIQFMTPSINSDRPWLEWTEKYKNIVHDGVRVTASSVSDKTCLADVPGLAEYAVDRNNGTAWVAGSTDKETYEIDFGSEKSFNRVDTFFEFHTIAYKYKLEYSIDGENWTTYADKLDNTSTDSPQSDKGEVTARYLRYSFPEGGVYVERTAPVGIFEINVYSSTELAVQPEKPAAPTPEPTAKPIVSEDATVLYEADKSVSLTADSAKNLKTYSVGNAYGDNYDTFAVSFDLKRAGSGSFCDISAYGNDSAPLMYMNTYDGGYAYGTDAYQWQATKEDNKSAHHIDILVDKVKGTSGMYVDGEPVTTISTEAQNISYFTAQSTYGDTEITIDHLKITTESDPRPIDPYYYNTIAYANSTGVSAVTGNFEVFTDETDELLGAIAKFDENGRITEVRTVKFTPEFEKETTKSVTVELTEDEVTNNIKVKSFLWRDEDMMPMADAAERIISNNIEGSYGAVSDITLSANSIFADSAEVGIEYVKSIDVDRLLAPSYEVHGLDAPNGAKRYGGWEREGANNWSSDGGEATYTLAGHSLGHWMSAAAAFYAETKDEEVLNKLNYAVAKLDELQNSTGSSYIGGVYESTFTWFFQGQSWWAKGYWVPWYGIHKIYQGLLDAYYYTGNTTALKVVTKFSDWAVDGMADTDSNFIQNALNVEYGGMNEVFAEMYEITGDDKYLDAARKFTHDAIVDPLISNRDELTGKHANTQIPKIIGIAEMYEQDPEKYTDYRTASENFWNIVVNDRSYAIGGNSIAEHFEANGAETLGVKTCESCNSYNMMKLTEHLYSWNHDTKYMDYYEKLLYNHILGQQDPDTGSKMYFVSLLQGHHRIYEVKDESWWCCTGTGMENPGRYTRCAYYTEGDDLYVNLYIPTTYTWADKGLTFNMETNYPYSDKVQITVTGGNGDAAIKLRAPGWLSDTMTAVVNDEEYTAEAGSYLTIDRVWSKGDTIEITLPMAVTTYYSRTDGQIAYLYGPITLAAELDELEGHDGVVEYVANETTLDSKAVDVPYLFVNEADPAELVEMTDADTLTFKIDGEYISAGKTMTLKPFFAIHHHFHNVYWDMDNDPNGYGKSLNAVTVDVVEPDGQQDEIGHVLTFNYSHNGSFTSSTTTYFWRDAWGGDNAYFGYTMNVNDDVRYLMVRYWGPDSTFVNGGTYTRDFNIYIDDTLISDQQLPISGEGGAVDKFYEIPAELLEGKASVNVKFAAKNSAACAGGVLQIRTVTDKVNAG